MKDYLRKSQLVHFVFPIDGDCVNSADGRVDGQDLFVKVKIVAPNNADLYVNDQKAVFNGSEYEVEMCFNNYRTCLTAIDLTSGERDVISVFRLKDAERKFRLSSDDNILFLKDIYDNQDKYKSIFENPYLKMYKKVHEQSGACVNLNLFYQTCRDTTSENYFDLSMMPEKYKAEWEQNSDWLRLSFHSLTNEPLWPYKNTTYEHIYTECKMVNDQIIRFAGKKSLSIETTLHFGATNDIGVRALRNIGYKTLAAYFEFDNEGNTMVSYHYPKDLVAYLGNRDFWMDTDENIMYCRIDRVLNLDKTVEGNLNAVKKVCNVATRASFIELMIHEQYFYETYYAYIPQFENILVECCKWLKEQGYKGVFLNDVVKEY